MKRQKAENDKRNAPDRNERSEELEQVAGNIEDDIGDVIVHTKEKELLYGPKSLLAIFGPMSVAICSQPKSYPVRPFSSECSCMPPDRVPPFAESYPTIGSGACDEQVHVRQREVL